MSFLSLLFALLIEQVRPFARSEWLRLQVAKLAQSARLHLDAGLDKQAFAAWSAVALVPALLVAIVYWALIEWGNTVLGFLWSVAVLYLCLGFRQFSHHVTQIRDALEAGNVEAAAAMLSKWQRVNIKVEDNLTIVRALIEHSVIAAHRHVFGVMYWYCIFSVLGFGPAGAVLYRICEMLVYVWTQELEINEGEEVISSEALSRLIVKIWFLIDWLPVRLTALSFAVVGNFEDAVDALRFQRNRFEGANDSVVLASMCGALNIELGVTPLKAASVQDSEASVDSPTQHWQLARLAHINTVIGLLWRSVVLWMLLLALLSVSRLWG